MFESLSERFSGLLDRLSRQGTVRAEDIDNALREVRTALLEADVALPVVKDLIAHVKAAATGAAVLKSVTPGQMVVKIVHDELKKMLAGEKPAPSLKIDSPPAVVLMVGLQGSGKTTTTAKLARYIAEKRGKRVLMASLDTRRPAAMEQLAVLGVQIGVDVLPIVVGQDPVEIARRSLQQGAMGGYDVILLDTAGRMHVDDVLMSEVEAVRDVSSPQETLLVVDGLTGQDALNVAHHFDRRVKISGVILTRMDGDGRGGVALSMRATTGKPVRFVGVGEKTDALEEFHPERIAGRILGMGDIVSLVEKAAETMEREAVERQAQRMMRGQFDLNDMKVQFEQVLRMGGMSGVTSMLPGAAGFQKQLSETSLNDRSLRRNIAIIQSMTIKERRSPEILQASRKKRIAAGAGVDVSEINTLLKLYRQTSDLMKKIGQTGIKGLMRGGLGGLLGGGAGGNNPFASLSGHGSQMPGAGGKLPFDLRDLGNLFKGK